MFSLSSLSVFDGHHSLEAAQSEAAFALLPRYLRRLESWLLAFCGFYGMLVSTVVTDSSPLMVLCSGFLGLAVLRWYQPAVTTRQWLLGAFTTLGLAVVIYLHPDSGGSSGPYLFLLILMAMSYPLAMSNSMAVIFSIIVLSVYLGSAWFKPSALKVELVLVRAVLIGGICFLSASLGYTLRRSQWLFETMLRDERSGAYNEQGLQFYGQRMIERAQPLEQPVSLALLRMPHGWLPAEVTSTWDLLSPVHEQAEQAQEEAQEHEQAQRLVTSALRDIAWQLSACLGAQCVVARMNNGDWAVLAPGITRKRLLADLMARFGHPLQIPFGERKAELFVPITPCLVEIDASTPHVHAALANAYSLWQRSERAGTVSLA